MICSICNKKKAVIFTEDPNSPDPHKLIGYCADCAKEKGVTTSDNLSNNINLNDMTSQIEAMLDGISSQLGELEMDLDLDEEDIEEIQEGPMGGAIPIGAIFGNFFTKSSNNDKSSSDAVSSDGKKRLKVEKKQNNKKRRTLDIYGTNLTNKAKNNQLDNVIGRDRELQRVIQILNRRSKNNPCLIGEPGVGKTAIAQGLAIKIAEKNVPTKLLNKEVYLLDMTSVVAGTQFRGQFESRMKNIIEECRTLGNIILVIDEIHNIIGAGDSEGSMNAANILKPSLANGEIQLIGTTTLREYRKHIEKDTALERRFQTVLIDEPNVDSSVEILNGIKKYYEDFHKVKISDDVIRQTVWLSEKYVHDRFLPDKAIDILDEACSRINLNNKELYNLESLKNELKLVQEEKNEAAQADSTEDYQKAADLKTKECQLIDKINKLEKVLKPKDLTLQDIAVVIENWTKIPLTKITEEETFKLLHLEERLHQKIVGQEEAVQAVSRAIRRNRAGLKSTKRPPSFMFVGPTGVGKTALAKSLAFEMFGDEDAIIRIDMSEYMESNSTAKLIGAPPGYVGYDDAGQLTEKVKRKPYSIILFDEIEKAHNDVFNLLLQVLDDGKLTDSQGNTVSFENTIIIMTSNAGSNLNTNAIGFNNENQANKNKILDIVKSSFRAEFINRIDEIIVFHPLGKDEMKKIAGLMCRELVKRAKEQLGLQLTIRDSVKDYIVETGTDQKYGARPLRRAMQSRLEDRLAEAILAGEVERDSQIVVGMSKKDIKFIPKATK